MNAHKNQIKQMYFQCASFVHLQRVCRAAERLARKKVNKLPQWISFLCFLTRMHSEHWCNGVRLRNAFKDLSLIFSFTCNYCQFGLNRLWCNNWTVENAWIRLHALAFISKKSHAKIALGKHVNLIIWGASLNLHQSRNTFINFSPKFTIRLLSLPSFHLRTTQILTKCRPSDIAFQSEAAQQTPKTNAQLW